MKTIIEDTRDIESALTVTTSDGTTSELEAVGSSWSDLTTAVNNLSFPLNDNYDAVLYAATQSAEDTLKSAYAQLTSTKKVKIKTLLNKTGGAFCQTPLETINNLAEELNSYVKELANQIGGDLQTDPQLRASISSLTAVQTTAQALSSLSGMYNAIVSLSDKLEPAFPYIEIVVSAASIWWTGGASSAAFTSQSAQLAMQELKKLIPLIIIPLKEVILNKEIDIPYWALGGLSRLQTSSAISNYNEAKNSLLSDLLIDNGYYSEVEGDLQWSHNYDTITTIIQTSVISPYITKYVSEVSSGVALQKRIDSGTDYWATVEDTSVTTSNEVGEVIDFSDEDIVNISAELIDAQDTSANFYRDRLMHKLILEQLKEDGAILSIEERTYDEIGTKKNPLGDRKSFKDVNDRIILFHSVLRAITGEERANITEDIPVIDFYRKEQTSLKNKYISSDFTQIAPISSKNPLEEDAPSATNLLANGDNNFINFALSEYDAKQHFYNTLANIPKNPNLQVDFARGTDVYSLKASGLLNGLFTAPLKYKSNGEDVSSWKFDAGEIDYEAEEEKRAQWISDQESAVESAKEDMETKKAEYEAHVNDADVLTYANAYSLSNSIYSNERAKLLEGYDNSESLWRQSYQALALSYGINIPLGVKYNPAHLAGDGDGSRHIIEAPLLYEGDMSYGGKAEYYYTNITTAVDTQLIKNHEIDPNLWASLGGKLEDVASILDTGYIKTTTEEKGIYKKKHWYSWNTSKVGTKTVKYDTYYSSGFFGKKLDYFLKNSSKFSTDIWSNKDNGNELVLDVDSYDKDISIDSYYITREKHKYEAFFHTWYSYSSKTNWVSTDWLTSESRVYKAIIKKSPDSYHSENYIDRIECIMPQELFNKKDAPTGFWGLVSFSNITPTTVTDLQKYNSYSQTLRKGSKQARLFFPQGEGNSENYNMPNKLYMFSVDDLGFEETGSRTLCSLYSSSAILVMKVSKVDYIKSPKEFDNFKVKYKGKVVEYNKQQESQISNSVPAPKIIVAGESCYVYTLEPMAIDFLNDESAGDLLDFSPIKYPKTFLETKTTSSISSGGGIEESNSLKNFINDMKTMKGMNIAVGLPQLKNSSEKYKNYRRNYSFSSFRMMDFITGKEPESPMNVKPLIKSIIKGIPIIKTDSLPAVDSDGNLIDENPLEIKSVTLEQMPDLLTPLIDSSKNIEKINEINEDIDLSGLIKRIESNEFISLRNDLESFLKAFETAQGENLLQVCKELDALLGDPNKPWIKIGEEEDDDISEKTLLELSQWIKTSLDGNLDVPVRYVAGSGSLEGDPSCLYYQRYLFLNNRLHWNNGHLALASHRMLNWEQAVEAESGKENKLEAYTGYLQTLPVAEVETLEYFPENRGEDGVVITPGKFYNSEVLSYVENKIDNTCLLICSECPKAKTCPFFDRAESIKQYIPEEDSYEIWLKDNKLNLISYETREDTGKDYLDIVNEEGEELNINEFKNRQKTYVEIIKNSNTDYAISDLKEEIGKSVDGFKNVDGTYLDNLGWLQGGRYGSIRKNGSDSPEDYSYLYDAIFVRDEETSFIYEKSNNMYDVTVNYRENANNWNEISTYSGKVRILIPQNLYLFDDADPYDEVYLVSDDTKDENGNSISPIVYIGTVNQIQFAFDLREDVSYEGATDSDVNTKSSEDPLPQDVAQQHINTYKWLSDEYDQWWMDKIEKKTSTQGSQGTITLEGRKRIVDVVDPLISESPSTEDVLKGKPFVNSYVTFLRKMRIKLSCFHWVKGTTATTEEIEAKKILLTKMKTNVRLVVIKK